MTRKAVRLWGLAGMTCATAIGLCALVSPVWADEEQTEEQAAENPFITNAKAGYIFRMSSFRRSSGAGNYTQKATGIGGWLYGSTGEFQNIPLSFGGTYNFVEPLDAPGGTPYNYVLQDPKQQGYNVVGEAYAKLRYQTNDLVVGRQSINYAWYLDDVFRFYNKLDQSMIGRRDIRAMQPITYNAATVQGRLYEDTVRYYGGFVKDMKQVNDNQFRDLYQGAYQTTVWPESKKTGYSAGMTYAGVGYRPTPNMMALGSYYAVQNLLNMAYLDFDYAYRLENHKYLRVGAQYMFQNSNGGSLVSSGRHFSTNYEGLYGELRLIQWWVPYVMLGLTANGDQIRSPYSIGPSYLVQRIGENSQAGEHTWILGTLFDFATVGLPGSLFDLSYGQRSQRHVAGNTGQPLANWNELATDLWLVAPQKGLFLNEGLFKNMRLRLRYAKVWEEGDQYASGTITNVDKTTNDFRIDLSWSIPFK